MPVYLDYNATAPIRPEAINAAADTMRVVGNASSIHGYGRAARKLVEDARGEVAKIAGVRSAQVIFNSGATEGNNTILSGYQDKLVFISAIEHPSVIESAPKAELLPVREDGIVDIEKFKIILENSDAPALVCIQLVNSETGAIQPVAELAAMAKEKGALVHCDAVQAAGRIPLDFKSLNVDYMTLSAHKCGGPQGAGALIFREGLQMPKFMRGGGQEKRQRAGTENIAAIAGFGAAAKLCDVAAFRAHTAPLQQKLEAGLKKIANDIIIVSENAPRVTNTTNIIVPNVPAETALMALDLEGIAVSSGSACSSGTFKPSHVLLAMGYDETSARSALRFSTGWATTEPEIDAALAAFTKVLSRVRR